MYFECITHISLKSAPRFDRFDKIHTEHLKFEWQIYQHGTHGIVIADRHNQNNNNNEEWKIDKRKHTFNLLVFDLKCYSWFVQSTNLSVSCWFVHTYMLYMYLVPFATIAISHREGHEAASKLMHIYIIFIRHTLNSNVAINGYTMESYICMRVFLNIILFFVLLLVLALLLEFVLKVLQNAMTLWILLIHVR